LKDVTEKNFGLLIAYMLPGAVALIGISARSATVRGWLQTPSEVVPSVGSFLYVTLASVAAGMTASAIRWALIDTLHHRTGTIKPAWDDSKLVDRLEAFEAIVEAHYRYYQFHSNMLVAMLFSYILWRPSLGTGLLWSDLGILLLSAVFFAVSRDNLRRYYGRAAVLLGTLDKESRHEQRSRSTRSSPVSEHPQAARPRSGEKGGGHQGS
jgi:hypothetical protein